MESVAAEAQGSDSETAGEVEEGAQEEAEAVKAVEAGREEEEEEEKAGSGCSVRAAAVTEEAEEEVVAEEEEAEEEVVAAVGWAHHHPCQSRCRNQNPRLHRCGGKGWAEAKANSVSVELASVG